MVLHTVNAPRPFSLDDAPALGDGSRRAMDPRMVLSSIGEAVYDWDITRDELNWTGNAATLLDVTVASRLASGASYALLIDPASPATRDEVVLQSQAQDSGTGVPYRISYALTSDHGPVWVEDTGRWFSGTDGRPSLAHGVVRRVLAPGASELAETQAGRVDPLTQALSRPVFARVMAEELQRISERKLQLAFLLTSIDDLAFLNQTYGFDVADEIIGVVAQRLRRIMRRRDCMVRYSGNKLGLLLSPCDPGHVEKVANRLAKVVAAQPVQTSAGSIAVSIHVGGVVAPKQALTAIEAMHAAEEALTEAKSTVGSLYRAYSADLSRASQRQRNRFASDEIIRILNDRQLVLAYEPVIEASSGAVAFHEALVRVRRPDGELLGAATIVPTAERLGVIRLIDHRVMEMALATLKAHPAAKLSINVSMRTAVEEMWLAALAAGLQGSDIASRLTIEITETAAIQDLDATARIVLQLKSLGLRVAIDDFGSGHTSFKALRALPVDILKLDGVFIQNISRSAEDRFFVKTLLDLARHLGLATVAEWVQDAEAAELLASWGVDFLQGEHCGVGRIDVFDTGPVAMAAAG